MADVISDPEEFALTLPEDPARLLRDRYKWAEVILEYGSGGSTLLAASLPGKMVFSVESDRDWARALQTRIDADGLPSATTIYHVDIGPVGEWGRPVDRTHWPKFHRYPAAIWDEPFFRQPDVVLIDGRFRPACLATVAARTTRPVTVLFDDYTKRPSYRMVETLIAPRKIVGRMAVFDVTPGLVGFARLTDILGMFAEASYATENPSYGR